jgi:GNAT superfamily N-acetyltransferase
MEMAWLTSQLAGTDRAALERHFLALAPEDRRLRFGVPLGDPAVRAYVGRIDFGGEAVFSILGEELEILAAAHLARSGEHGELGLSVLRAHRNRGMGSTLLERATLRARNWGVRALLMHCLGENAAMMRLAQRRGMEIVTEAGEVEAWARLPWPDAGSLLGDALAQNLALFDRGLKRELLRARRTLRAIAH